MKPRATYAASASGLHPPDIDQSIFDELSSLLRQLRLGKVKEISPSTWQLEGTHYILTLDQPTSSFCVQAKDGRGELLRLTHSSGDKVELSQGIKRKDVANFQHIQQISTQEKEKEKQDQRSSTVGQANRS